jgi:Ser/Thr protein kinase RdoA (MazF antagonist)
VTGIHESLGRTAGGPERFERTVAEPLRLLAGFGNAASVREGCGRVLERAGRNWFEGIPAIPQHGDLYPGNLVVHGDRWRVVDWESFGATDLPAYDLYTLLLSLLWEGGNRSAEWAPALTGQIPAVVAAYARRIGLQAADMPVLLPVALANWFRLQWSDGREKFSNRLYQTMTDYFECETLWEKIFFSAQAQPA